MSNTAKQQPIWREARLTYAAVPLTAVAFALLQRWQAIADVPLWIIEVLLVGSLVAAIGADRRWRRHPTTLGLHQRIATQVLATTSIIYVIGWGPALIVGYVLIANDAITAGGSRAWRPTLLWSCVGIAAGQTLIAAGATTTLIDEPQVHSVALLAALGMAFVVRLMGQRAAMIEEAQADLQSSQDQLDTTLDTATDAFIEIDESGAVTRWNTGAERIFGWAAHEALGESMADLIIPPRFRDRHRQGIARFVATGQGVVFGEGLELVAIRRDGRTFPIELTIWPTATPDGYRFSSFVHDISARKQNEHALVNSEASFRMLFENNPHPMWVYDAITLEFLEVNRAAVEHYRYPRAEFLAMHLTDIQCEDEVPRLLAEVSNPPALRESASPWRHQMNGGRLIEVEITSHKLTFADRQAVLVAVTDVTDRNELERQLRHQAFHDPLTGLANRVLFEERLAQALTRTERSERLVGVLVLGLDDFATVNDGLGHTDGDQVLVAVAARLTATLRPQDTVARIGGDEFVVLCDDVRDEDQLIALAELLTAVVGESMTVGGHHIKMSTSVGIAVGQGSVAAMELLRDADAALSQAKRRGRGAIEVVTEAIKGRAGERLRIASGLRTALERDELRVYYQPVMSLATGTVVGAEALVRWHHPHWGVVSPALFIPVAEASELILSVGALVLRQACEQAARWNEGVGTRPFKVSVNLSARQLTEPGLAEMVASVLADTGLAPSLLSLEITESVLMDYADATMTALNALRAVGVGLAVDDFGTGYSSLQYLRRFPVDQIKVDQSFVAGMASHDEDLAIVASVVSLGHSLGLTVLAEGVETTEQLATLEAMGCEQAQGYLWSPPLPAGDFERWMAGSYELGGLQHEPTPITGLEVSAMRHLALTGTGPGDVGALRPHTVLIVDDLPEHRLVLRLGLERTGSFVVVAEGSDGAEALELATAHRPDLILLDLTMPGVDGRRALPALTAAVPGTRVVVLTNQDVVALRPSLELEGAAACLAKGLPIDILAAELLLLVRSGLGAAP